MTETEHESPPWIRGPQWPPPPETEKVRTNPCLGCGRPLKDDEIRHRARKKHPVCGACYLTGDQYLWQTCEVCGEIKHRTEPGKDTYVCSRHDQEFKP